MTKRKWITLLLNDNGYQWNVWVAMVFKVEVILKQFQMWIMLMMKWYSACNSLNITIVDSINPFPTDCEW